MLCAVILWCLGQSTLSPHSGSEFPETVVTIDTAIVNHFRKLNPATKTRSYSKPALLTETWVVGPRGVWRKWLSRVQPQVTCTVCLCPPEYTVQCTYTAPPSDFASEVCIAISSCNNVASICKFILILSSLNLDWLRQITGSFWGPLLPEHFHLHRKEECLPALGLVLLRLLRLPEWKQTGGLARGDLLLTNWISLCSVPWCVCPRAEDGHTGGRAYVPQHRGSTGLILPGCGPPYSCTLCH